MLNQFAATTDDLTPNQFQELLNWLWQEKSPPSNRALRKWRKLKNLPE